ncbi:thioesterase family protein [Actinoallomurus purpureus]|uniref:acyl-CoA thioesterase n=1 Tax=Actinoallomurus purpureus TaxID=478114 RepID=UPI002093A818|nr:thioesterase family protein [Actinoallomurus purpureus]MCO6010998.1 thioesterase family protein [Actinoallomurus purpureus]
MQQDLPRTDVVIPSIDRGWWSWAGAHGGRTLALLGDHTGAHAAGFAPRSVHASFLTPIADGDLHAAVECVRKGRSSAVVTARLTHEGKPAVLTTSLFGAAGDGLTHQGVGMPAVPPPEDCEDAADILTAMVPYAQHLGMRPTDNVLLDPKEAGTARIRVWLTAKDPSPSAVADALIFLDAIPPSLWALNHEFIPIPSVDAAFHFTDGLDQMDAKDWSLVEVATERVGAGWLVESGSLWSRDGVLLASSRQTRRVLG